MDILVSPGHICKSYIWSTTLTHILAVDVNIYGSSAATALTGNHENTEIGEFIRDYLELDLRPISEKLVAHSDALSNDGTRRSWLGALPEHDEGLNVLDDYHGDFKRRI